MGKRCVSKFVVDNTDFPIMQISDFSIIPNRVDNSAYQYDYYQSLQPPSGVSSVGNSFNSMVGDIITSGSVVKNVENFNNVTVGRYYEYGYGHQINSIYVNDENSNMLFGFGAYIDNEERDCTYYASIILDDDSEYADVITMYSYVSRGWTKLWHFGGNGTLGKKLYQYFNTIIKYTSNGGGATHIAKRTGQLKDLSSYTSDILIVSGGGGGGYLVGETAYDGADAGGISGSGDNSADQSTGNAFGQGESGTNLSGGGSGLYGGYKGTSSKSGGAGSGYIGNSLLSNKKMVGYNVPTSSAEGTKTESVNEVSASAVSGKPKSGNGFAKIKFLRGYRNIEFLSMLKTQDLAHRQTANNLGWYGGGVPSQLFQYLDSDWILGCGVHSGIAYLEQSGEEYILDGSQGHDTYMLYPIRNDLIGKRISKVNIKALLYDTEGYSNSVYSNIIIINGNDSDEYYSIQAFNYNAGTSADRTIFALNTWYSFSVDVGNVILPDYIQMYVAVGKWKFKDIVFDVEE